MDNNNTCLLLGYPILQWNGVVLATTGYLQETVVPKLHVAVINISNKKLNILDSYVGVPAL